ncbi:MAG: alpha/beta hydrolase [Proteobacteria bacterium]|nr:alpha/beta hydrolase [Pseudomonadota bacterium]
MSAGRLGPLAEIPTESVFVANGDLRLRCVLWGDRARPPVLLIHGNGAHAHWWAPLVPALARERLLVSLDQRGHGRSDRPLEPDFRVQDFAKDFAAVVDQLGLGPLPVIAHSMGGRAAVYFAARQPEKVSALAVLDTSLAALDEIGEDGFRKKIRGRRDGRPYPSRRAALGAFRLVPEEPGVPADVLSLLAEHAVSERGPGGWQVHFDRAVLLGDGHGNLIPLLGRLRCPLWIGFGRESRPMRPADLERLVRVVPEAVIQEFPGAHHFFLSHPEPAAAWLRRFLASAPATPERAAAASDP